MPASMWSSLPDELVAHVVANAPADALSMMASLERRLSTADVTLCTLRLARLRAAHTELGLSAGVILGLQPFVSLQIYEPNVDAKIEVLADATRSGGLSQLQEISLHATVSGPAVSHFAEALGSGAMPMLQGLYLDMCAIGDAGIVWLALAAAQGALSRLERFSLRENQLGTAGIRALVVAATNGALPRLTHLHLERNLIDNDSMKELADALAAGALPSLKYVDLGAMNPGDPQPVKNALRSTARYTALCARGFPEETALEHQIDAILLEFIDAGGTDEEFRQMVHSLGLPGADSVAAE